MATLFDVICEQHEKKEAFKKRETKNPEIIRAKSNQIKHRGDLLNLPYVLFLLKILYYYNCRASLYQII